jgi:PAS domain S-box-containing protein
MVSYLTGGFARSKHTERLVEQKAGGLTRANDAQGAEMAEHQQGERSLRESERRCLALAQDTAALVCRLRPDGALSFVNEACCACFGKKRAELVGADFFQFVPEQERAEVRQGYMALTADSPVMSCEHSVVGPDGALHCHRWTARLLCDEEGRPMEFQSVGTDVSALKSAAEALQRARQELEQHVRERTAQLSRVNEELQAKMEERSKAELRIARLNSLREALIRHASVPEKLKAITDGVVAIFGADFARIWLTKPGDRCSSGCVHAKITEGPHVCRHRDCCLHLMASSGRYTHLDGEVHRRVPFGCYKIGRIAAGNEDKFLTNDVTRDPRVHNHEWARQLGLVAFAGYRVLDVNAQCIGVLALFSQHAISSEEDALLEGLAHTTEQVVRTAAVEEVLEAERDFSTSVINDSPTIIWGIEPDGSTTFVNPAGEKTTGYSAAELCGRNLWKTLCPGEDYRQVEGLFRQMTHGEVRDYEMVLTGKDGQQRAIAWNSLNRFDAGGELVEIVGFGHDVTERKRAEQTLRRAHDELEQRVRERTAELTAANEELRAQMAERKRAEEQIALFRRFAEDSGQGFCMTNLHGDVTYVNPALCCFLGENSPPDVLGECFFSYFSEESRCKLQEEIRPAVMRLGQWTGELTLVLKDGRTIPTIQNCFLIRDEDDAPLYLATVITDITERKQAEEQAHQYAQRLEWLNAELARSNKDLQEFTYTVSHDLQEPLRKIHTFGQFLIEDCGDQVPPQGREHLKRMQDAALRMKHLIQHLMALSRVDTQGGELLPVSPHEIIKDAVETLSERVSECQATVLVQPEMPTVMADPVQLGQVFQNLIGNALKFREPGRPPRVDIGARVQDGQATFHVADNGIGIEERFLEKIFGVFQRLHPRDKYEGDGVGLALCEKIVRRHGGKIWAESKVGDGTAFYFTVPIAAEVKA